jgi:hypothetical protein
LDAGGSVDELIVLQPKAIAMTDYHVALFYGDKIRVLCRMNDEMVWEQALPEVFIPSGR